VFSPQHFEKAEQKEIRKQDWSLMQTSRKSNEKQKGEKKNKQIASNMRQAQVEPFQRSGRTESNRF
jgi:hypothetical protein